MRIAIDAHSVGAQLGGNETYAVNLIEALAEIDQQNHYTLYVTKPEALDRFANRWPNFAVRRTVPHTPLVRIPLTLSRELRRHLLLPAQSLPRFTIWLSSICLKRSIVAVGCSCA